MKIKLKKVFKKAECTVKFKSPRNLESILNSKNKPQMPLNCQPGVYFLLTECRKAYTGETKKQVPNKERRTREGHVPEWQRSHSGRVKTIAVEPQRYRRKVREALEIRRLRTGPNEPTGINRDYGDYITTDTWKSLFTKINQNKHIFTFDI